MGKICTFFGRRDVWIKERDEDLKQKIKTTVITLIENEGVDTFYVGGHGRFDFLAGEVTRALKQQYPFIQTWLIMAYGSQLHQKRLTPFDVFLFPKQAECCKKLYAIPARHQYMASHADFIIAYVDSYGGAYKAVKYALKKEKNVINLGSWDLIEDLP